MPEWDAAIAVAGKAAVTAAEAFLMSIEADQKLSAAEKTKRYQGAIKQMTSQSEKFGVQIVDAIHPTLKEHFVSKVLHG